MPVRTSLLDALPAAWCVPLVVLLLALPGLGCVHKGELMSQSIQREPSLEAAGHAPAPAAATIAPASTVEWVPQWAKRVVWYQIFPDRFRNGDPTNDPRLADLRGAWPHDTDSPWQIHPWGSDWYRMQPWEQANGHDIWHQIQRRRYGGDLQGILDQLDYLQDLGVTAIYLNPVFTAPSLHKYDGAMYHHIDPTFGPDPAGDRALIAREDPIDPATWQWTSADRLMLRLIDELHRRGMRVVFDGVFNHMGITSFAFRDVVEHQRASRFADWFWIHSWDDATSGTHFDYAGWYGVRELPELREDENGIVAGPKRYIFDATQRWMDPDGDGDPGDGIDGWRLDVAFCVKHPFWKDWRRHVKSINPQAYLSAEFFDPIPALQPYLRGDEFDSVMNYNFTFAVSEFFIEREHHIGPTRFDALLRELRDSFDPGVAYVKMNLLDSHDSARIASQIVNPHTGNFRNYGDYFARSKGDNPQFSARKPGAEQRRLQRLIALFQFGYLGAPMIYYGDEAGMWGANDPCCRKPMVWPDLAYEPECIGPDQREHAPDAVAFDHELHDYYRRLIRIRNTHEALQVGDFETVLTDDARDVYAFVRRQGSQQVLVVLNNQPTQPARVVLDARGHARWHDLLAERELDARDGQLELDLPPCSGLLLRAE